jgi:hypothetical protein
MENEVHYNIQKSLPPDPVPSQINPVQALPPSYSARSILMLSSDLCLDLPNGLFLSSYPAKIL